MKYELTGYAKEWLSPCKVVDIVESEPLWVRILYRRPRGRKLYRAWIRKYEIDTIYV